ncbi:3-(3-hydroxy-phenyl)propionate hydroxylase [Saccharopolyspora lacisalsi]|uniref:3-(3-hydroxy-phenyl)propionate hydroxylase n=1 Tax=Halosaccharopolyspora lacisalsi TaxID=1000566 RepID=A0A839DYG2_9PSEU|nr:FAD-dependent monooxygenase [Halosaccharopolyspora lacisalsi]MBA8826524.1 3-(3-hydroxy-phenyl)propionate hydroxylase [Halosaccharopolyspora lacisalsi]
MYFTPHRHGFTPFASSPPDAAPEPVVIVGAGPVGLALALGLARRGVVVTVLESGDSVSYGSRAICLSRHSLEVLERLGVGERFAERSLPWTSGRSFHRDTEVLSFAMPHEDGDVRAPMVNISQSEAEQILVDEIEATDHCTARWRCRVLDCTERDDHVGVRVETPEGSRELRARWVIAADGARSTVRESLVLRMSGTSYEGRYVIADIHWRAPLPTERRVWFDPPSNPGSTIILHRQPADIWRVDYQLGPDDDPEVETTEERIRERITRHLDWLGNTEPWTLEWSSLYRAHSSSLDSYLHGRVLFAGDAAHLVPIFGVRGLNSGLEDADTLAWTLSSVVHGTAGPELLRTYAAERRAAWRQYVDQAEKSTLFMTPGTHGYAMTRDAVLTLANRRPVLRELINPRQSGATHSRTSPLTVGATEDEPRSLVPGDPVPDHAVRVAAGGARTSGLNAERGPDLAVLALDSEPEALADKVAALRARLAPGVGVRGLATSREAARVHGAALPETTLLDDSAETLARALDADFGEVFVIRPAGLLLGRFPDLEHLGRCDALADHVLRGGSR